MSSLILAGDTSGTITLTVPATAGTNTITLPASTGTAITTASTSGIPNTVNWTTVQTSSVSPAVAGVGYPMNTTSGALTVTLPAAPTAGNLISIVDYAGTAATNNITINPNGNKIQGTTSNRVINTNREAINLVYVDSTQGWLAYADVYSTTAPIPIAPYTASYLVIAGGGGGGNGVANISQAGGGGAGGYLTGTLSFTSGTVYTAVVGAGGTGAGSNGNNSTFPGVTTAIGGGYGGTNGAGASGGSGGGGGNNFGGAGTPGQGNAGAESGGGGGAGAAGVTGVGTGAIGLASSITGSSITRAGGGGGYGAIGGAGGGGNASTSAAAIGGAGTVNTGGGGGAGFASASQNTNGGAGGSGVVILSVPTASYSGTTTGSPTITTSGANTIITFASTGSGTYTA